MGKHTIIDLKKTEYQETGAPEGLGVPIRYRPHPIYADIIFGTCQPNQTITDALKGMKLAEEERFFKIGIVRMNGDIIDRLNWSKIKLKPYNDEKPVCLTLHMDPAGGASKKIKNIVLIVAAIAVVAATGFIGAGGLATLFPTVFSAASFGAGTLGAALAAAAVGAAGSLALSALTPSPITPDTGADGQTQKAEAYARGNLIEPGGAVPRVAGTRRVFPVLACQPLVELFDDGDTIVEALYMLAGPHNITDPRIEDVVLDDIPDIQYEMVQGYDNDPPISIIQRHGFTKQLNKEISRHKLKPQTSSTTMRSSPNSAEIETPQWQSMRTKLDPDEFWIQLALAEGLSRTDASSIMVSTLYLVRMKPDGSDTWINLPMMQIQDNRTQSLKKAIKLIWSSVAPTASVIPTTEKGWNRLMQYFPPGTSGQLFPNSFTPVIPWIAHTSFAISPVVSGTSIKVADKRIRTSESTVEVFLDPAIFPRGTRWTVQVKRSYAFDTDSMNYTSGVMGATFVQDVFGYFDDGGPSLRIMYEQDVRPTKTFIANIISVYNTHPIQRADMALMAIKAKNQAVDSFSVVASGLVNDWNGAEWLGLVATSNPAPHLRELWAGMFNADPLESDVIDETNLVAWRQWCIDFDRTVDLIMDGRTVQELANVIASCGRGRIRMSDLWGVFYDRSREGVLDTPVQVFSPRTSNNFAFMKAFEKRPNAFRVTYRDIDNDYEEDELYVAAPDSSLLEAVTFEAISIEGIVDEQKVRRRVFYDHLQLYFRDTIFSLDVDFAALVCRMGDFVGVNHDAMVLQHGHARVRVVTIVGPDITQITLDSEVVVEEQTTDLFTLTDVFAAPDFFALDVQTGVALMLTDATGSVLTKPVTNAAGVTKILTFAAGFTAVAGIEPGMYIVVGRVERTYNEFIVVSVNPQGDLNATLILTPYEPYMYGDEIGVPWGEPDYTYWSDGTGWSW